MSDWFLGEIRAFAFGFAPMNWALCDGATLQVKQNQALFSLIGNYYGGDGRIDFKLPDLRGRTPVHLGFNPNGQTVYGGLESVALSIDTIPSHSHGVVAVADKATATNAANNLLAEAQPDTKYQVSRPTYAAAHADTNLIKGTINASGGSDKHDNMQPFAIVNYCIALQGSYPPRD